MADTNLQKKEPDKAKKIIIDRLWEMGGEANITELKDSLHQTKEQNDADGQKKSAFHFIPTMGSGAPRSRSFKKAIRSCEGSELIERKGSIVRLTEYGEKMIQEASRSSSSD